MKYIYRWLRADREEIDSTLYDTVAEAQAAKDKHASFGAICSEEVIEVPDDYERYEPPVGGQKLTRIISDGIVANTRVFDSEGKPIPGVRRVRIDIEADRSFVVAQLELINSRIDVAAQTVFSHDREFENLAVNVVNMFDQANTNNAVERLGSRGIILRNAVNELRRELNRIEKLTILGEDDVHDLET